MIRKNILSRMTEESIFPRTARRRSQSQCCGEAPNGINCILLYFLIIEFHFFTQQAAPDSGQAFSVFPRSRIPFQAVRVRFRCVRRENQGGFEKNFFRWQKAPSPV